MQVEDSELQFLEGTTEANTAWLALVTRHEKQGPHHASSSHSRSSFRLVFRRRLCCSNCTKNKSLRVFEISRVFRVITQIGIIALSQIGQSVSGQSRSQLWSLSSAASQRLAQVFHRYSSFFCLFLFCPLFYMRHELFYVYSTLFQGHILSVNIIYYGY